MNRRRLQRPGALAGLGGLGRLGLLSGSLLLSWAMVACAGSGEPSDEGPGRGSTSGSAAPGAHTTADDGTAAGTRLELTTSALADLYFDVRAQAAAGDQPPRPGFEQAVAATREIQDQLGSFGGWGPLDTRVLAADGPARLVEWFAELDEPMERRGETLTIRDPAVRLARALVELWPRWQAEDWPDRRAALDDARARLSETFEPRQKQAFADMMSSLGIEDPGIVVPALLLSAANPPGAMTYRMRDGPTVVVDIGAVDDPMLLVELLLHEGTHTLDLAAGLRARQRSQQGGGEQASLDAFRTLRSLLAERGVDPRDPRMRDIPHLVMFAQAAATTRRFFDPDHVPYREVFDVYGHIPDVVEIVQRHWLRHLDGEIGRDEALRAMVEEIDPAPTPGTPATGPGSGA